MDDVLKNPTKEQIASILSASEQGAVKWLKDPDTGNIYYWPAESHQHMEVAYWLKLRGYTKGIVLQDGSDAQSQDRQAFENRHGKYIEGPDMANMNYERFCNVCSEERKKVMAKITG